MDKAPKLNEYELRFIDLLTCDVRWNVKAAYAKVYGCGPTTASTNGQRLMRKAEVRAEIDRRLNERREALKLKSEDMLRELLQQVTADVRDLCEYHKGACRHCYGVGFRYQRTQGEFERELAAYKLADKTRRGGSIDPNCIDFDTKGGIGYNPKLDPNPDCPECFGDGVGYEVFKDTRILPPDAARIYAGIKKTKDGVEYKIRNQDRSLENALRHLGLLNDNPFANEESSIPPTNITFEVRSARKPDEVDESDDDADISE